MDDIKNEFKALADFAINHTIASGIVFCLGMITIVLLLRVPYFMLFVIQWLSKYDKIPKWLIKILNPSWIYYKKKCNAVILEHIDHCKPFLDLHFAGEAAGQIWLFKSDLRAFWEEDPFKELYVDIVGKRTNIKHVKILISQGEIDGLDVSSWKKVHENISEM